MALLKKRLLLSGAGLALLASLATSCKPKCYDCVVTDPDTHYRDTINTLCTDQPQYTASYLQSWKAVCTSAGGETEVRDKD